MIFLSATQARVDALKSASAWGSHSVALASSTLSLGLLLSSRWSEPAPGAPRQLIIGRIVLAATTCALLAGLSHRKALGMRLRSASARRATLLVLTLLTLAAVMVVSIVTRGTNSAGAFYGYAEMALGAAIAVVLIQARPDFARVLLACAAGGAFFGCLEALVTGNTTDALHGVSGRLSGFYGNPNFLGFAGSLAVPVFLAFVLTARRHRSAMWAIPLALTLAAVVLSYSRGSILATTVGAICAVSLTRQGLRRRLRFAAVSCAAFAALAGAAYPLYLRLRTHADFVAQASAGTPDRSGWDPRGVGLISAGPSTLSNRDGASLEIDAHAAGEGASMPLGDLAPDHAYRVSIALASPVRGLAVGFGAEDNRLGAGPVIHSVLLRPVPRELRFEWTPTSRSADARVYVWLPRGGTVVISKLAFGRVGRPERPLGLRLLGASDARAHAETEDESRFVHSREDAATLALRLFAEHPLTGIGWQRFAEYSSVRLHYGPLATHDEYLRYAAELGVGGLALLLAMIFTVARGAIRLAERSVGVAAASCAATGCVGLLFANALEVPSIALPLFIAAAVLCCEARNAPLSSPR